MLAFNYKYGKSSKKITNIIRLFKGYSLSYTIELNTQNTRTWDTVQIEYKNYKVLNSETNEINLHF